MHTSKKSIVSVKFFVQSFLTFFVCRTFHCAVAPINWLISSFAPHNPHKFVSNISILQKSTADMNQMTTEGNSRENPDALGPGSLEDLGASEWLRIFTSTIKQRPEYDLNSNKGPFLGGLRFMLERFHEDPDDDDKSTLEAIMTVLKDKNRNFSLNFIIDVIELPTGDQMEMDNRIAGFALVLEYNRMGKSIRFMKRVLEQHPGRFNGDDCFFRTGFIQQLIHYEKQWELETLVDIHRQECVQSELSR